MNDKWTAKTTDWKGLKGKRRVGRPKRTWADDITNATGNEWQNIAIDWDKMEETRGGLHLRGPYPKELNQKLILTCTFMLFKRYGK